MHLQFHSNHIIAYNDLGVQLCELFVIILVQGAAITEKSSVKYAVYRKTLSERLGSVLLFRGISFPIIATDSSEWHSRSSESLSSFKVIPLLSFLLISALLLSQIFLDRPRRFGQLTGLLICLIVFRIFLRQLFLQKIFHFRYRA